MTSDSHADRHTEPETLAEFVASYRENSEAWWEVDLGTHQVFFDDVLDVLTDLLDALHDERLFLDVHRSAELTRQARRASKALGCYDEEGDWL